MTASAEIQRWIDRLHAGDDAAREALLRIACGRLERLARKMLHRFPRVQRWEETDDVLQNASLRLYRTLAEIKPATVTEFFRLAALNVRRELLDLAKHYYGPEGMGAHHVSHADAESRSGAGMLTPADDTYDPSQLAVWAEFHEQVEHLPEQEREVFDLLWYQELSQAEAAELLGVSERTIKRRWQSARLHLHDRLHGELPEL
jgi:RNA polymerase sigma-70 factor (ECF subfamily)